MVADLWACGAACVDDAPPFEREKTTIATNRTSFDKMQRDRAKKARAALKREKRQGIGDGLEATSDVDVTGDPVASTDELLSPSELLHRVEDLHRRFEAKQIDFETFEEEKADLMRRLPID